MTQCLIDLLMRIELTTFRYIGIALLTNTPFKELFELLMRIELTTSSLPRKCSTPELQQLVEVSGHWSTVIKTKNLNDPVP